MILPLLFLVISLAMILDWVSLDLLDHCHRRRCSEGIARKGDIICEAANGIVDLAEDADDGVDEAAVDDDDRTLDIVGLSEVD